MTHLNTEPETEETSSVPKIDTGTIARTTTLIISQIDISQLTASVKALAQVVIALTSK